MRRQWFALLTIVILAAFTVYKASSSSGREELPQIGYKAPRLTLQALDGKTYSLDQLGGKPVILNFWASWCGPCRAEAPELVRLYEQFKGKIEIYAINVTASDTIEDAKAFADEFGFTFPVLLDEQAEVARRYGIRPIPTTFFVNADGIIMGQVIGLVDSQSLEEKFKQLLRKDRT